jgi:site-specific recombinase XerD
MATVSAFIRTQKSDKSKSVNVRFRLRDGRDFQLFHKSEILVVPDKWDDRQQKIKARCIINEQERKIFDTAVNDRKALIKSVYLDKGKSLTSDVLDTEIDKFLHPEKYAIPPKAFFYLYDDFLASKTVAPSTMEKHKILGKALLRFELYRRQSLDINTLTSTDLQTLENYLRNENKYDNGQPSRSLNTIAVMFKILRSFVIWCKKNNHTANDPFNNYKAPPEKYGTPYLLTLEERNRLYHFNLSVRPELERQRDIFVFQCVIGCRVGDLIMFTKENVINDTIEYYAEKTVGEDPQIIRVPLNSIAREILKKYADYEGDKLLPFISEQKYNNAIKEAFTIAGLTRRVVVLNPETRESEVRPLNEIASSHLARRTFCGNLYKKVKDPNLVGALSGHKEGSKAFARYRDIDEEMKQDLVKLLE